MDCCIYDVIVSTFKQGTLKDKFPILKYFYRGLNLSKIHQPKVIVVYAIGTIYGIFKAILNIKVIYHIRKELDPDENMLNIDEV